MRPLSRAFTAIVAVLGLIVGCDEGEHGPGIDVDRALDHVSALAAKGPRPHSTPASAAAAALIEERLVVPFERAPVGTVELPPIEVLGAQFRTRGSATVRDSNIILRFGPPGKALLLMAHYDTVDDSPGAADDAASVAILIELARVLAANPPEQPVIVAFTAAEEVGLVGAEKLAAESGDQIAFAIALDLVGGDGPLVVNGASELIGKAELGWLRAAADRAGVELTVPIPHRIVSRWWPQAERADHGPFTRRGIRAIHFYNRGNDGDWIDIAYHGARDLPSRVHRESVADVGRLVRALIATPMPTYDGDGFDVPIAHVIVPRWSLVAFELVLVLLAIYGLVRQQARDRRRGLGLLVGLVCLVAAAALAYLAEQATEAYAGAWALAPLRMVIAWTLVLAGTFGVLTRAAARMRPWIGTHRYRVLAATVSLTIGSALVVIGAAELAWVWLVPAVAIALAPAPVAIVASALPALLVLQPLQLREAVWNGFLPSSLPLSLLVAVIEVPFIVTVAWALRRRVVTGPLGTLVLGVGCGLAVIAGLAVAVISEPSCRTTDFSAFGLACERV